MGKGNSAIILQLVIMGTKQGAGGQKPNLNTCKPEVFRTMIPQELFSNLLSPSQVFGIELLSFEVKRNSINAQDKIISMRAKPSRYDFRDGQSP